MKYFIDTNIIIDFLNKKYDAVEILSNIAKNEENEIYINRLVYTESLRTIEIQNSKIFRKAKETLEVFEKLDINQNIYDEAINFSRFAKSKGINLKGKCEAIDFIHFICAKFYRLEIVSHDKDFEKLENIYHEFKNFQNLK
ncbi:MAG: PIN domain-containing protein [Campylobacterales bacterium]|nr:PIN domain-containing protein [Campylobacterales bacterium]